MKRAVRLQYLGGIALSSNRGRKNQNRDVNYKLCRGEARKDSSYAVSFIAWASRADLSLLHRPQRLPNRWGLSILFQTP